MAVVSGGQAVRSFPSSQVPLLEIDGMSIVQSGAIVRYIGRKCGLDGGSAEEKVKVDVVSGCPGVPSLAVVTLHRFI